MPNTFLYIATFLFMVGLSILTISELFSQDISVLTYVCAGFFMVTGIAVAVLLSCFEYYKLPPSVRQSDEQPLTHRSEIEEEPLETV